MLELLEPQKLIAPVPINLRLPLVGYRLDELSQILATSPTEMRTAAGRSQHQHRFPAAAKGAPVLLVDADLRLPISLNTVLQTSAMYQKLDWEAPITRRLVAIQFFEQYVNLLIKPAIQLALTQQIGLDLATGNVVAMVERGDVQGLELRQLGGVLGAHWRSVPDGFAFEISPTSFAFYRRFVGDLLAYNLRPVIESLLQTCNAKPEVFWDYAIEAVLNGLNEAGVNPRTLERARLAFMIEELNPGDRLLQPERTGLGFVGGGGVIYLKRKCCEKFKKKKRCDNCPNRK